MTIRPYEPGDEQRMREYAPQAFGVWARYGIDRTLPRDKTDAIYADEAAGYAQRAQANAPGFAVFVAEVEGCVVGHIVVLVDESLSRHYGLRWGVLRSLAVDPEHHHQGIGTALIERGLEWMREQGCEHAEVATDQNNIGAIRAYEKCGFRVIYCGVTLSQRL